MPIRQRCDPGKELQPLKPVVSFEQVLADRDRAVPAQQAEVPIPQTANNRRSKAVRPGFDERHAPDRAIE